MAKKKREEKQVIPMSWVVAYIDTSKLSSLESDLAYSKEYKDVVPYIPMVKVLNKRNKGKKEDFQEVPLLFNYGFFSIPRAFAISKNYLENMRNNVACIFDWVKDPTKVSCNYNSIRIKGTVNLTDKDIMYATATSEEISALVLSARESTIFSSPDLEMLGIGDMVTLHGYPWEGMDATIVKLDFKKEEAIVKLLLFNDEREIKVKFSSIFFSIYQRNAYNPDSPQWISIEDLKPRK